MIEDDAKLEAFKREVQEALRAIWDKVNRQSDEIRVLRETLEGMSERRNRT